MTTEAERLPNFPTVLRKMWSGSEVQDWIDQNMAPLLRSQAAEIERANALLRQASELFARQHTLSGVWAMSEAKDLDAAIKQHLEGQQ